MASDHLSRNEVGLPCSELTYKEEQAVIFVASERQRQQKDGSTSDDDEFYEEAEPEEAELTDAELLQIARMKR